MKQLVFILSIMFGCIIEAFAHSGFIQHGEDIVAVLGLEYNTKIFNRSKDTKNNNSWVKFISSDMIDNTDFHKELESSYPGFSIKGPKDIVCCFIGLMIQNHGMKSWKDYL